MLHGMLHDLGMLELFRANCEGNTLGSKGDATQYAGETLVALVS